MTRAWNITILSGVLLASFSLTQARGEVIATDSATNLESFESFFPDDKDVRNRASRQPIRLTQHEEDVAPAQVPPPPNPDAAPSAAAPPNGGSQHAAPPISPQGPYGPDWTPQWPAGASCGPMCGPDCQSCCGTGCCPTGCGPGCAPGGPAYIQNGWGDVWNNWLCCCPSGIVAGVEGTFLVPIDEPTQRVILTDLVTDRQWSGEPRGSLGAGVRTWIGLQKCGWGARFRYWHFGNDHVDPEPEVPVWAQPTIHESYHLEANVLDFELTQRFCMHCWQIDTSFGARYADLERFMQIVGYGQVGNGVDLYGLAMGANQIDGTGFTASIGGTRRIHPCSNWYFYWSYRGSVLWADSTVSVLTDASAFSADPPGAAASRNHANAAADHKENVFISEAQVGLEYRICTCRCGQLAFRGGVEFQHWDTGDLFALSESNAFLLGGGPPFGGDVYASADAHDSDLDLIGFVLGAEWTY